MLSVQSITKYISSAVTGKFPPSTLEAEPKLDGDSINCPPTPVKQQKQKKMSKPISFNTRLNDNNFDKLVLKSKSIWMVVFARDNCGYCQQLAPHWAKVRFHFFTLAYIQLHPVKIRRRIHYRAPFSSGQLKIHPLSFRNIPSQAFQP
uniref:Thioredoxin domain-containing protein n=1 Tax=Spongospora subterranea TaxID=70186 RepID=A0A0H5RFC1_9EUKA|eukprot:CRZ12421.1 hypothetical protein [Spongospora subterranea]